MKRVIVSLAIILVIILMTLSLQSCFTPYPEKGHPDRERRDREREREFLDSIQRQY